MGVGTEESVSLEELLFLAKHSLTESVRAAATTQLEPAAIKEINKHLADEESVYIGNEYLLNFAQNYLLPDALRTEAQNTIQKVLHDLEQKLAA